MGRVLAVANQKGGVGKTTTVINVAAYLAEAGHRVLAVDIDPQGNTTTGLGVAKEAQETSIYDVLLDNAAVADAVAASPVPSLHVIPATLDLAGAEIELTARSDREGRLKTALDPIRERYDYVFVDCPPSLGLLTVNALTAADAVLIPIQCEFFALEGLSQLLATIERVRRHLNPTLEVEGVVLTMYDARTNLSGQVAKEVRDHFGAKVYRSVVPRAVRLSEAPSHGQPISQYDPRSKAAMIYAQLAKEVMANA